MSNDRHARRARPLRFEGLEPRALLTLVIHEYPIPTAGSGAGVLTPGPDGNLWFTEMDIGKVARIDAATKVVTEITPPTPHPGVEGITAGPDGALWFTESNVNRIGRVDPKSLAVTEFALPTDGLSPRPDGFGGLLPPSNEPSSIVTGHDGGLWFLETYSHKIGRIDPVTHAVREYPVPSPAAYPDSTFNNFLLPGLTVAPDGTLDFAEESDLKLDFPTMFPPFHITSRQFDPTTGLVTDSTAPAGLTPGPDGNLWFSSGKQVGQYDVKTHAVTLFQPPGVTNGFSGAITAGPDNALWFGETSFVSIGAQGQVEAVGSLDRIDATTHVITSYPLPVAHSTISAITTGPGGNLWFLDRNGNLFGEVRLAGSTTVVTASPTTATAGTPVTFRAVVSPASGPGAVNGSVTFTVDGKARPATALKTSGGQSFAVFTAANLSAGRHTVSARFAGNADLNPSASAAVPVVIHANPAVVRVRRTGSGLQPTKLVLTFNVAMDARTAEDVNNYELYPIGANGLARPFAPKITVVSAVYDPAARTVTLTTRPRLALGGYYLLSANGAGPGRLTDAEGDPLVGTNAGGRPGSNFLAVLHGFGPRP